MLASCFPINLEKEVTGSIRRDSSGEKFNQNVMIGATNDVFTLNKGLFRKCPCHSHQGNQMYCFHFTRHAQCVIKNLFPFSPLRDSHATRLGTPVNYNPIAWHALARGKVAHNLLTWDWNSVRASSQSLIGRSRNFSGQSVSDSSCTTSRGASRPSLQSTRRATTSLPNVSNDLWPVTFGEEPCDTLQH